MNPGAKREPRTQLDHPDVMAFAAYLKEQQDLAGATLRNYVSDVAQFFAWCAALHEIPRPADFGSTQVTTAMVVRYRTYLQADLQLQPQTINRYLTSVKRFFAWGRAMGSLSYDPAAVVKMIPETTSTPRHLTDQEEDALVAAVTTAGNLRDRVIIVLMLHTGLRAGEVCGLRREQVHLQKRSGMLAVCGKRNKYREVPLNATARSVLTDYLPTVASNAPYLFLSERTGQRLTERGLGYLIAKYTRQAHLVAVSPHDLRHRFGYRMAQVVPLHRLAQIMGHDSLDTTMIYTKSTTADLQQAVEKISWA